MDKATNEAMTNQKALSAAIERLNQRLAAVLADEAAGDPLPLAIPTLEQLAATFHLSPFEQGIILWTAAVELDRRCADLTAQLHGHGQRIWPTFGLALAILPEGHWSALTPTAALRHWQLIDVRDAAGLGLSQSDLKIDERILHFLTGIDYFDPRLHHLVRPLTQRGPLIYGQGALVDQMASLWNNAPAGELPVIQLVGSDDSALRTIAVAAADRGGATCFALTAEQLPLEGRERAVFERLWEREAVLSGRVLLIERLTQGHDPADHGRQQALIELAQRLRTPLIISGPARLAPFDHPLVTIDVPPLPEKEQAQLWKQALGPAGGSLNGMIGRLVSQFNMSGRAINEAVRQSSLSTSINEKKSLSREDQNALFEHLWSFSRGHARPALDNLAMRLESAVSWEDLVVPEREERLLRDLAAQLRVRYTVYQEWGMGHKSGRGLGLTALFAGPSGTGKTLAAEVIANELGLDLYIIDLSQVVSKYIGETEKNLGRIFDAAEAGGAVLLFDEADALFGKRSEVKDSHDRYANIEVSYLLQRMEAYRGLAILTTNMKQALDAAFLRRLRFVINFRFPDAAQRTAIWQRMFPPDTPTADLDWDKLGQLNVTGGHIRSIAINGAFYAAAAGEPVSMAHLRQAAQTEYAKLDRTLSGGEVRGWV